jgi:NTE family protein
MSGAAMGAMTTLLRGSPSGQAAERVNNQTRFTLVLGGGGMKGVAHVGVLQALTERGLVPAQIVASSVGALVGAAWSAGKSVAELRDVAVSLRSKNVFALAHADMAFKRMRSPALFRREPLDELIHRLVGPVTFQELRHPLIVNTVDINSGMQVFWGLEGLDTESVRDAVFASCAIPGFLPPREIRGQFYVDGATVDNLPVGTARILGPDLIVAVDVSASNAYHADTQEEGFAAVFARATEIAMQSLLELRLREWTTPPVYYIHPRVEHIPWNSFTHLRELVEEGYRATIAALDRPQEWPGRGDAGVYPRRAVTVRVQPERCIGCGACLVQAPPGMFVLDAQGKAVVTRPDQEWSPMDGEFIRHCPTYAISARAAAPKAAGAAG